MEDKDRIIESLRKEIERLNEKLYFYEKKSADTTFRKEPVIIVTGGPRRGTSMMMHCLELGGIKCVYNSDPKGTKDSRVVMRNPKGFYEGGVIPAYGGVAAKRFGKAAAELSNTHDVYYIVMERGAEEIMRSWNYAKAMREGVATGVNTNPENIEQAYQLLLSQLHGKKTLIVNYNDVNADPLTQFNRIKEFIPYPFDAEKASKGVDPNIYIDRRK